MNDIINTAECPECGADATDKEQPGTYWMTCSCGYFWIEPHDRIPAHTLKQAE